jgi:hypothetical protein
MTTMAKTTTLVDYRAAGGKTDSIENQRICSQLVEREVLHCVSSMVSHFSQNVDACCVDVDYDDVLSMCIGQDYEEPADEHIRGMDRDDLLQWLEDNAAFPLVPNAKNQPSLDDVEWTDDQLRQMVRDEVDGEWEDFCNDQSVEPYDVEAYEHWAVSTYLFNRLQERGEIVGELFDFHIWGRACTGQSISMDGVIASIAAEMEILVGQRNDWSK